MAEHYASLGHEVVVTTIFPHYPDWKPLMPRRVALTERHQGVEVRGDGITFLLVTRPLAGPCTKALSSQAV